MVSPAVNPASAASLRFRRQYYLGPQALAELDPEFAQWQTLSFDEAWCLSVHPDLALTHVREPGAQDQALSCTLLGFAFDPMRPDASAHDIVQALLDAGPRVSDIVRATDVLGGRWVLIIRHQGQITLCADAVGLRQIAYLRQPQGADAAETAVVACAAHPGLLARVHGLTPDPEVQAYLRTRGESDFEVYWLPGDRTLYREVRALLPNHQLVLSTGHAERFWPRPVAHGEEGVATAAAALPFEDALSFTVTQLRGFVAAAQRQAPISVSMTAGWDSRLMLALAQPVASSVHCFTLTYPHLPLSSRDVAVPARLLRRLGLEHHLVRYPKHIDPAFKQVWQASTPSGVSAYCADAQAMHEQCPSERLCLTGDVAEIIKCHYRLPGVAPHEITAAQLAQVCSLAPHPFVLAALEEWLVSARKACDQAGSASPVGLLDLLCWEQMGGRWQAQIRAEYDVAQESFAPLNCRHVLATLLAVAQHYRMGPDFPLLRAVIEALWPEVLQEPVNPPERISAKDRALKTLGRWQIGRWVPRALKDTVRAWWH